MDLTLVIPAAGRGTRLRPETVSCPKVMIIVGGKPLLQHVLDVGHLYPLSRIVIIVNSEGAPIRDHFGGSSRGVPINYVLQNDPTGLADAVYLARSHVRDRMLVINGDEIFIGGRHSEMIGILLARGSDALVGYVKTDTPTRICGGYGLEVAASGRVVRLVEKPTATWNDNLGVGVWMLGRNFFDFFYSAPVHPARKERDLVAVIQCMIDRGLAVHGIDLGGVFFNINTPGDRILAEFAFADASPADRSHGRSERKASPSRQACFVPDFKAFTKIDGTRMRMPE
jgi:dTDP-glucose pyrophosphorylase